jgi:hypothetical protein
MFPQEFIDFGYLEVDYAMIRVYKNRMDFIAISVGYQIEEAYWSGRAITVILKSGAILIYRQFDSFEHAPEWVKF